MVCRIWRSRRRRRGVARRGRGWPRPRPVPGLGWSPLHRLRNRPLRRRQPVEGLARL